MHFLKSDVDGDVYQTGWLFHELNQKVALLFKKKIELVVSSVTSVGDAPVTYSIPNNFYVLSTMSRYYSWKWLMQYLIVIYFYLLLAGIATWTQ